MWSAELPTICDEFLLKRCVGVHPIFMTTVLVYVLKLQHGRSSVPQVRRRARQDALSANKDSISTSSVGRATLFHSEKTVW